MTDEPVYARRPPRPVVLHDDDCIVVVDKPPRIASIRGTGEPGLTDVLRELKLVAADAELRMVHRLDKEASGVIVLARSLAVQRALTEQFVRRRVEKAYLALVRGRVAADGEVDLPLRADAARRRAEVAPDGKPSLTEYRVIEHVAGHTLLECRPRPGRLHQIRVHLAAIGHPLAVDPLYGGARAILLSEYKRGYRPSGRRAERPLIDRLTLHALRLTFDHPDGRGAVTFEAPPPKDFRAVLSQLRRA